MAESTMEAKQAGFLESKFPVLIPFHPASTLPPREFESFLQTDLSHRHGLSRPGVGESHLAGDDHADTDTFVVISSPIPPSTTADIRHATDEMGTTPGPSADDDDDLPFMKQLLAFGREQEPPQWKNRNKMLTENADVAYRSTTEPLVDLFSELEDVVFGPRLRELLDAAWRDDPLATLKIIFNARSIHLGKSSRLAFYRCAGWLAQSHPLTLVGSLQWLSRPVIEKERAAKQHEDEREEMVFVDREIDVEQKEGVDEDGSDAGRFDVRNGVAHGYWKDLLNILVISVQGKLDVLIDPRCVLNPKMKRKKQGKRPPHNAIELEGPQSTPHETRDRRHQEAIKEFNCNPIYRALHLTVARLFAAQLKADLAALRHDCAGSEEKPSLCAKWAPSPKLFHDKHTFIVSSIAEILHPRSEFADITSCVDHEDGDEHERELYLRHAREAYRKDIAALRKHLQVVERNLTANTLEKIRYERVPSLAMRTYAPIFADKDTERFEAYINSVAAGQAQISGATLLPSTLIKTVRETAGNVSGLRGLGSGRGRRKGRPHVLLTREITAQKQDISAKVVDGQWRALVQRIKNSGTLSSSIAVCDVSGSMGGPVFPDGTCPMDSAIGLSLLVAEVTAPPFGGAFITFSTNPAVQQVLLTDTLQAKYQQLKKSRWDMNTDFVAVFEKLILPMALTNQIAQEDMVKRVFVFSDMHFDAAQMDGGRWTSSYERIQQKFRAAGYEMPQLVFWNLAGGRAGYDRMTSGRGDPTAPKPVMAHEEGTAMVSGYSQGMLKVFLENGSFDEPEKEEVTETMGSGDPPSSGNGQIVRKKQKIDPLTTVKRAIGHKAYSMLEVLD